MWKEGAILVRGNVYHYEVKVYPNGSEYGIAGGRISKLRLTQAGKEVASYDRGWDMEPACKEAELAIAILLKENK